MSPIRFVLSLVVRVNNRLQAAVRHSELRVYAARHTCCLSPVVLQVVKETLVLEAGRPIVASLAFTQAADGGFVLWHRVTKDLIRHAPDTTAKWLTLFDGDKERWHSDANPLGKNHDFLGWADVFSGGGRQGTVDGVEDFNVMLSWSREWEAGFVRGLSTGVRRHEFEAERTGADLGSEWDAFVELDLPQGLSLALETADYDGPGVAPAPADVSRTWVVLSYRR